MFYCIWVQKSYAFTTIMIYNEYNRLFLYSNNMKQWYLRDMIYFLIYSLVNTIVIMFICSLTACQPVA